MGAPSQQTRLWDCRVCTRPACPARMRGEEGSGWGHWSRRAQTISDAVELHVQEHKCSSTGTSGCLGTRHREQAALLLPHLERALGASGEREVLLLFVGPEGGCVAEKPTLCRAETRARGIVCISRPGDQHTAGRKEGTASQIFLPECLSSSGEFHSNGLVGFYLLLFFLWKKTLSLFKCFYKSLKLGAACDWRM